MSKGSRQRPVDWDKFGESHDRIFRKRHPHTCPACGCRHIITYTSTHEAQCQECKHIWSTAP